jgi:hypothetical protein
MSGISDRDFYFTPRDSTRLQQWQVTSKFPIRMMIIAVVVVVVVVVVVTKMMLNYVIHFTVPFCCGFCVSPTQANSVCLCSPMPWA